MGPSSPDADDPRVVAAEQARSVYNRFPDESLAPHYKGRLLIKQSVKDAFPHKLLANALSRKPSAPTNAASQVTFFDQSRSSPTPNLHTNSKPPPNLADGSMDGSFRSLGAPANHGSSRSSLRRIGSECHFISPRLQLQQDHQVYKKKLSDIRSKGRPFRRHLADDLDSSKYPQAERYKILALVIQGTEIPELQDPDAASSSQILCQVQCGKYSETTQPADNDEGVCNFYSLLELNLSSAQSSLPPSDGGDGAVFPRDLGQVPDITLTICEYHNGTSVPVSYHRVSFSSLMNKSATDVDSPSWLTLREDKAIDLLGSGRFPGSVLLKIGCFRCSPDVESATSPLSSFEEMKAKWTKEAQGFSSDRKRANYQLRCHIFSGADLPSVTEGLPLDPYFKVSFNGEPAQRSKVVSHNNNFPTWYETVCFETSLPPPSFFPPVSVRIFDEDAMGSDDYISCIMASLSAANVSNTSAVPPPTWFDLFVEAPGDTTGRILCSFQLVNLDEVKDAIPRLPIKIMPEFKTVRIEVIVVGCTNLDSFQSRPIEYASLEFVVGDGEKSDRQVRPGLSCPSVRLVISQV